ncbi:hypothetical protein [Desulfosporosinus hippei]|uniref:hypothetical protein n=1 Tax=Desulfosporosinus hippei TaxID=569859 RepID=UPI001A9A2CAD|nr:hypothetical protein [Desulfosporosinus hippei]
MSKEHVLLRFKRLVTCSEEKKKVTKKLLKKGMDFKSISDITGMSEEEIENLR